MMAPCLLMAIYDMGHGQHLFTFLIKIIFAVNNYLFILFAFLDLIKVNKNNYSFSIHFNSRKPRQYIEY